MSYDGPATGAVERQIAAGPSDASDPNHAHQRQPEQPATSIEVAAVVRERLIAMRDRLIASMAADPHLDGGSITLLGSVGAALAAIDLKLL